MPIYRSRQTQNPDITPAAHVFHIAIFLTGPQPIDPFDRPIAYHQFEKAPGETWDQAKQRCYDEIVLVITNWETAQTLHPLAQAWLQTQTWNT